MASLPFNAHPLQAQSHCFMNSLSSKLKPELHRFRFLCTSSSPIRSPGIPTGPCSSVRKEICGGVKLKIAHTQLKDNWLASLSCPFPLGHDYSANGRPGDQNATSDCVIGVDPDVSGAVALLRTEESSSSAQVYDSPHLQVLVGGKRRKRLDAKSIVQLLHSFNAPIGTTAYLEQSIPFPQDGKQTGKWSGIFGRRGTRRILTDNAEELPCVCVAGYFLYLFSRFHDTFFPSFSCFGGLDELKPIDFFLKGWWSGGFGYGLWIGILVGLGFSVVPVPSLAWKNKFELSGKDTSKDDSRRIASTLFPSLSPLLKRKKDHGRAEALLIAAYGKGLDLNLETPSVLEESVVS